MFYPPIITVGAPVEITPPCEVGSVIRAADRKPICTVSDPLIIVPVQVSKSVTLAAGIQLIITVGIPVVISAPPIIGQVSASPIRAESIILPPNS
jgi:hypothetical protein